MPTAAAWGGESTSLDYKPFVEGDNAIDTLDSILGTSISGITPELLDPLFQNYVKEERGKIVRRRKTVRPAEKIGGSFTLQTGNAPWTPVLNISRQGTRACPKRIYAIRLCTDDPEKEMAYVFTGVRFNPETFVNDFITTGGDAQLAEKQVEGTYEDDVIVWAVGQYLNDTLAEAAYAVAFRTEECEGCLTGQPYTDVIVGGGSLVALDPTTAYVSDDRFANNTVLTHLIPDEHVVTDIYTDGKVALLAFADTALVTDAGATTGGVSYSDNINEAAPTFTLDTNITEPVRGITRFLGVYLACGGTTAGDGLLWKSENGITWEAVDTGSLATGKAFSAIAADEENERFYIVGEDGVVVMGKPSGDSYQLSALTPTNVSTTDLFAVHVLGYKHVALGGATGYYAESLDGGDTWELPAVPGTSTIRRIKGSVLRTVVAAGSVLYARSALSLMEFKSVDVQEGATVTGDISGLDGAEDHNYFVWCDDDGNVGIVRPFYPGA